MTIKPNIVTKIIKKLALSKAILMNLLSKANNHEFELLLTSYNSNT